MPSYVAFLRAINLGAKRKFPKDAIRAAVESTGATGVETYINSGNVRLTSRRRSRHAVEADLEAAFLADRGFEVQTIAYTCAELARIAEDVEELRHSGLERHYVLLLKQDPPDEVIEQVRSRDSGPHRTVVRGRAAHLLLGEGYLAGGVDPLRVEGLLGVVTNRNHTVITTLARKWC
jgi:uncharacterized protein (DUF1697 family)